MRKELTDDERKETYVSMYTGHGCVYFGDGASSFGIGVPDLQSPLPIVKRADAGGAFGIAVADLLAAMASGEAGWPAEHGAADMLQTYNACASKLLEYRHALRPPAQSERELMRRIRKWAPLGEHDLLTERIPPCTLAFSLVAEEPMPAELKEAVDNGVQEKWLRCNGCMRSYVFTAR
jgi:hypothetical protein